MSGDFETEPKFQKEPDWIVQFAREEVLEMTGPAAADPNPLIRR